MHSVGLEPTKLILIRTRTTRQATGGCAANIMSFVGVDPHNPEIVRHIGLIRQYPLYWKLIYRCREVVKKRMVARVRTGN